MSIKTAIAIQDLGKTFSTAGASEPKFIGTIASACDFIGVDRFIEMARLAQTNDPRARRFLDLWDALDASEQRARGTADDVCARLDLPPLELLRIVAEAAYLFAMYMAQLTAAIALPSVVARSVEAALTPEWGTRWRIGRSTQRRHFRPRTRPQL